MASETDTDVQCVGKNIPSSKRKLQKHLRSAGLAYVSRTGKIIPAKQVSDELCQCPHKCNDRVSRTQRENLFTFFYHTLGDANAQNEFLRSHMDVRARVQPTVEVPRLPGTRPPRRITCKYLIPLMLDSVTYPKSLIGDRSETLEICQKAFCNSFVISTKRVRLQREKLIHSMGLNSYHHQKNAKKKQTQGTGQGQGQGNGHGQGQAHGQILEDALLQTMMMDKLDGKNVPELVINRVDVGLFDKDEMMEVPTKKCLIDDPLIPLGISVPEGVTIAPVTATPDHDRDIAIVNNFFSNQLWKPEYIGAYS